MLCVGRAIEFRKEVYYRMEGFEFRKAHPAMRNGRVSWPPKQGVCVEQKDKTQGTRRVDAKDIKNVAQWPKDDRRPRIGRDGKEALDSGLYSRV